MTTLLNAGFGEPLSDEDFELIRSLRYDGIRQGPKTAETAAMIVENALSEMPNSILVVPVTTPDLCHSIAHEVAIAIVASGHQSEAVIQVGNEEDLGGKRWHRDPRGWAMLVADVLTIARQHGCSSTVVSGGISSTSKDALRWLEDSRVRDLAVGIGYHQYRSTAPSVALKGYASREAEFRALKDVACARSIWCTEAGWSTAPHTEGWGPFKKRWQYTDEQVLAFLREEMYLNEGHEAKCFTIYQLNDGPDPKNDQDRFGIRRTDGTLKPQAAAVHP